MESVDLDLDRLWHLVVAGPGVRTEIDVPQRWLARVIAYVTSAPDAALLQCTPVRASAVACR
jgi:hypothetical protein